MVWATPVSLAATQGIARTFFLVSMASSTTFCFRIQFFDLEGNPIKKMGRGDLLHRTESANGR